MNYFSVFLAAATCLLSACQSHQASRTPSAKTRRVLLISLDTLRADHLGSYGHSRPTSPAIDALAAEGVRFTNCVSVSPWTLPSHVSMFTGLYPTHNGVTGPGTELNESVPTLTELLSQAGFATSAVIASDLVLPCKRCRAGFDQVTYFEWRAPPQSQGPAILDTGDQVTRAALKWLKENGKQRFFLFLHYYDLHDDYAPKKKFAEAVGAKLKDQKLGSHEYLLARRDKAGLTPEEIRQAAALYDGEIRQVDSLLAELFDFLKRQGWWDETMVIVTADHGEEFEEHGGLLHGRTMYEELLHVPLIIKGPGVPPGKTLPEVVQLTDIAPTILALTGVPIPPGLDGHSLRELLAGSEGAWKNQAVAEADHFNRKRMAREKNLKLIVDRSGSVELYDLDHDPAEQHNLAPKRQTAVDQLRLVLRRLLRPPQRHVRARSLTPRQRRRLRALGYID